MPLPLIPIIIGAGAAALGIGKSIKAANDNADAAKINKEAQSIIGEAHKTLNNTRDTTKSLLDQLGNERLHIAKDIFHHFLESVNKLHDVNILINNANELTDLKETTESMKELKALNEMATTVATGLSSGAVAGALTAFGAYGAAGTFAAASTGTAISTLSGAAATNATLAFFGGGSLAAGGLGIAGGTMVLGGLVAGPALAIMGLIVGSKASANLDTAKANRIIARRTAAECETAIVASKAIGERADLYITLIKRLEQYIEPLLKQMDEIIETQGTNCSYFSEDAKNTVCACFATISSLKAMVETPLIDKDGALTEKSKEVSCSAEEFLNKNNQ